MPAIKKQLVVFDFDWSMIDQDSDRWLFEVLAPDLRRKMRDRPREPGSAIQWTDLVAGCLNELSERGVQRQDIEGALCKIPFHPAMKRGIQLLKHPASVDTTLFILSNSNTFFINTILQYQGLEGCISNIVTNSADFSEPTNPHRLVLHRRVDPSGPQHGCTVGCAVNMCKGQELTSYLDAQRQSASKSDAFDRIIYIGDGSNDFCPVLRLRSQDIVLCRRFRGLESKIADERARGEASRIQCAVEYWSGTWEVEEKFKMYAKCEV